MSKEKSLFTAIEWNGRTLNVLGYIPAEELKKIADDFQDGIEVKHEQVEVVDGELVRPRLLAIAKRTGGQLNGHGNLTAEKEENELRRERKST